MTAASSPEAFTALVAQVVVCVVHLTGGQPAGADHGSACHWRLLSGSVGRRDTAGGGVLAAPSGIYPLRVGAAESATVRPRLALICATGVMQSGIEMIIATYTGSIFPIEVDRSLYAF